MALLRGRSTALRCSASVSRSARRASGSLRTMRCRSGNLFAGYPLQGASAARRARVGDRRGRFDYREPRASSARRTVPERSPSSSMRERSRCRGNHQGAAPAPRSRASRTKASAARAKPNRLGSRVGTSGDVAPPVGEPSGAQAQHAREAQPSQARLGDPVLVLRDVGEHAATVDRIDQLLARRVGHRHQLEPAVAQHEARLGGARRRRRIPHRPVAVHVRRLIEHVTMHALRACSP